MAKKKEETGAKFGYDQEKLDKLVASGVDMEDALEQSKVQE